MLARLANRMLMVCLLILANFSCPLQAAPPPKNVIVIIGDGMGAEQIKAARIFATGDATGTVSPFPFETLPFKSMMATHNASGAVTDSAAAATAMATGRKVNNGVISVALPGDGAELPTTLEVLKARGKRTGLVTTATEVHDATPAAFGAHETSRDNKAQIAADYFNQTRPNVLFGYTGTGITPTAAANAGYTVVSNTTQLTALNTETTSFVSGQFSSSTVPPLSTMAMAAIKILDNDPDGFFLLIEHEGTDVGGHANNLTTVVNSLLELNTAINAVLAWAEGRDDTLILITGDHETGGLTITETTPQTGEMPAHTYSTTGHSGVNVPLFAKGPNAEWLASNSFIDNTELFAIATAGGPIVTRSKVTAGSDDAEQHSGGLVNLTSTDLELTNEGATNQVVGIRFNAINIPRGALIKKALIQFKVDEVTTATTSLTIRGQAADNASTFTTATSNISMRPTTSASTAWTPPGWTTVGQAGPAQQTPDLRLIVQEIVNRAGWARNNSMAFMMTGTGTRTAFAFEGGAANAPELLIEWVPPVNHFYGTYQGGTDSEHGNAIAVDANGNVWVAGRTWSTDFPTLNAFDSTLDGWLDGFIAKYDPAGNLLFASYLGGSSADYIRGLAVDKNGNAWVTGLANSTDFPTQGSERTGFDSTHNGSSDGFVAKITSSGTLAWASFLGGNNSDVGWGIATDNSGNAYVTGNAYSADFPTSATLDSTRGGDSDVFVVKISAAGDVVWSTYVGGNISSGGEDGEVGESIDVANDGTVWVVGETRCTDFPLTGGFDTQFDGDSEAFIVRLSTNGQLLSGSYLGGNLRDNAWGVRVDHDGNGWITGTTLSSDLPTTGVERTGFDSSINMQWDSYLAKVTPSGQLAWATYLGMNGSTYWATSIALDMHGNAFVAGHTHDIAPTQGVEGTGFDTTFNGVRDPVVMKINTAGDFAWGTYLGGSHDDSASAIAIDLNGYALVTGFTSSSDYPTQGVERTGPDTTFGGGADAFITKTGTPAVQRVFARTLASSDDAEQISSGVVTLNSTDLELITDASAQTVGVRFPGIKIPKGINVTKACVQFTVDETGSGATSLIIKGESNDNAPTFTTAANNVSTRPVTSASILWSPAAWNVVNGAGPDQRSPEARQLIQEIINRAGWNVNNAMALIITGSGKRVAYGFDGSAARAPQLRVEWIY